jgi:hypothetical protein
MSNKLMLGLWRYVLHVPPFVWQKQIEKGKRRFEKEYGKMPEDFRNVHHFVVRELPRIGKPLTEGLIAEKLGLAIDRVRSALDYLEKRMTYLYRNKEGKVIWAYPVTVEKTPHRLAFDTGEELYAA